MADVQEKLKRILDRDNGHCGESTSERIAREREQQPICDAIAELIRLTADNAAKDQRITDLEGALRRASSALCPFATVGAAIREAAQDGRWLERVLFYAGDDNDPQKWSITGRGFNEADLARTAALATLNATPKEG